MKKAITLLVHLVILLISTSLFISAQNKLISPSTTIIENENAHKLISTKVLFDIEEIKTKTPVKIQGITVEEKIGVILYFEELPSNEQILELQKLGVSCYTDSWIPPLENHPYGFFLAEMPPSQLNNVLSKVYLKKMDSSTRKLYPNNNRGTAAINADMVWTYGLDGSGIKISILDSGLDDFYNSTDLPATYDKKDYSDYPTLDNDVANSVTGHGTHVTGSVLGRGTLSAGNVGNGGGTYKGSAPGADLVFLKIGNDVNASATDDAMISALKASVDVYNADVVTMSYGGWTEHHDGSSPTEQAADYIYNMGVPVFISAGNAADDKRHYSGTVAAGPGSETGFIQVDVNGAGTNDTGLRFNLVWSDGSENKDLSIKYYNSSFAELTDVTYFSSTESVRGTESRISYYNFYVSPGDWTFYIKVVNQSNTAQFFHVYEDWGMNVTFNNHDPFYTIGSPASADHAFAVGSFNSSESWVASDGGSYWYGTGVFPVGEISYFSSLGPRIDGFMKPDITAAGALILSLRDTDVYTTANAFWVDNDGIIPDPPTPSIDANYYKMQGTSMACPLAAGAAALFLQNSPGATPQEVYDALTSNAAVDSYTGSVPNSTFGYGKLDILAAITNELFVNLNVFLEGPYNTSADNMNTTLGSSLPLSQPFNTAPWNYTEDENVEEIPANVVDWLLVELRTDVNTTYTQKAAFVKDDGSVVNLNGNQFTIQAPEGDYYLVMHHRNHLAVMSKNPINISNNVSPPTIPIAANLNKDKISRKPIKLDKTQIDWIK